MGQFCLCTMYVSEIRDNQKLTTLLIVVRNSSRVHASMDTLSAKTVYSVGTPRICQWIKNDLKFLGLKDV